MKSKVKFFLAAFLAITVLSIPFSTPTFAANNNNAVDICNLTDSNNEYVYPEEVRAAAGCPSAGIVSVENVVTRIINGIIAVLGIVCVVFIVLGGVQYMTSAGDPSKLQKAKHTILYACIGLIICVLAFAITNFVINLINGNSTPDSTTATLIFTR